MNRNDHMAIGTSIGFINSLYLISYKPADKNAKIFSHLFADSTTPAGLPFVGKN